MGLGPYFQKIRFFTDLVMMFWGLGYTINKMIETKLLETVFANLVSKLGPESY